ncbi:MAG: 50S ribosomal protein L11 methyltransferase [Actinomycetota bacterium]|nr:50S ribosomal protein L11 methyltransferase [Actinomycetota bacterium]
MTQLRPGTILERSPNVAFRVEADNTVEAVGAGGEVDCGPHGLAILDVFSQPCRLEQAVARLSRDTTGVQDWVDLTSRIVSLHEAGVLRIRGGTVARTPVGFSAPPIHIAMLDDRTRTSSYLGAISQVVREGDVVVDLGTGSGVLAVAAARAGASRVYAMEATSIGRWARAVFDANGYGDKIHLVSGWSTRVDLPERADVLVSEMVGDEPLAERMLEVTLDARRRFLKPNARLLPHQVRVFGLPVTIPNRELGSRTFNADNVRRWRSWYGVDFTPLLGSRRTEPGSFYIRPQRAANWAAISDPVLLAEVDLSTFNTLRVSGTGSGIVTHAGRVDGVLVHFEVHLAQNYTISTDPRHADRRNHWRAPVWLLPDSVSMDEGDRFTVSYTRPTGGGAHSIRFRASGRKSGER